MFNSLLRKAEVRNNFCFLYFIQSVYLHSFCLYAIKSTTYRSRFIFYLRYKIQKILFFYLPIYRGMQKRKN